MAVCTMLNVCPESSMSCWIDFLDSDGDLDNALFGDQSVSRYSLRRVVQAFYGITDGLRLKALLKVLESTLRRFIVIAV